MPNVEIVTLSVNEISSLKDFANCRKLRELYLRRNCIIDIKEEVQYLKDLPNLKVLWLSDNPCSQVNDYRSTIIKNLPGIEKLDNIVISHDEVNNCLADANDSEVWYEDKPETEFEDVTESAISGNLNEKTSTKSLLNETNKLREQLGLQPLAIDDISRSNIQDSLTQRLEKKRPMDSCATNSAAYHESSSKSFKGKSSNLLSAVTLLLNDMNEDELNALQKEVEQKLWTIREKTSSMKHKELIKSSS